MPTYLSERRTDEFRAIIYDNFELWNRKGMIAIGSKIEHLAELLGKRGLTEMLGTMTAENEQTIKALAGPHAWAVYKMLLVKRKQNADINSIL